MKQIVLLYLVLLALGILFMVCCLATCGATAVVHDLAAAKLPAYRTFATMVGALSSPLSALDPGHMLDAVRNLLT